METKETHELKLKQRTVELENGMKRYKELIKDKDFTFGNPRYEEIYEKSRVLFWELTLEANKLLTEMSWDDHVESLLNERNRVDGISSELHMEVDRFLGGKIKPKENTYLTYMENILKLVTEKPELAGLKDKDIATVYKIGFKTWDQAQRDRGLEIINKFVLIHNVKVEKKAGSDAVESAKSFALDIVEFIRYLRQVDFEITVTDRTEMLGKQAEPDIETPIITPIKEFKKASPGLTIEELGLVAPKEYRRIPFKGYGETMIVGISTLNKEVLYGVKTTKILDQDGDQCKEAVISLDDNAIYLDTFKWMQQIGDKTKWHSQSAGHGRIVVDVDGNFLQRTDSIDKEGNPPILTSSSLMKKDTKDTTGKTYFMPEDMIELKNELGIDEVLEVHAGSTYQIVPVADNEQHYKDLLKHVKELELKNKFLSFKFAFKSTATPSDAYLIQKDDKYIFMVAGVRTEPFFLHKEEELPAILDAAVSEDEEEEDEAMTLEFGA